MPKRTPPRDLAQRPPPEPGTLEHHEAKLSEQERRIDEIVHEMQSGAWLTGVSERALSREWNLAPDTVRKLSAEASRVVRRQLRMDPEAQAEARAAIVQTFGVICAKAMAKGDPQSLRVALDATRALGFYMGVEPAKKLEVGSRQDAFMEGWTTEEKLAYANEGRKPRRAVRAVLTEGYDEGNGNGEDHEPEGGVH